MGDNFFEYVGVPRPRFELWRDILRDVGFARGYGPAHGQPGYEEHQKLSRQAIEQLWPHLDVLARLVKDDLSHIHRSIADARAPQHQRRLGSVSLDLSHAMSSIESLILGTPVQEEIPNDGSFRAPGHELAWRIQRSFLLPEEYAQVPPGPPVVERLRAALQTFASRGDVYVGWIAWYGYE
ncbi:MAG TPA: hypothetical protein VF950_07510 [Planctomycetota bacterium]